MNKLLTTVSAALVSALTLNSAMAHDEVPGEKQQAPVVLQGGTLHTVSNGVLTDSDLVFENGKITAIGRDVSIPQGAEVIDISGKHVYPGVIAMDTTIGLNEIEAVRATRDAREVGDIHPEVAGHIAFNADSEIIPTVRYHGITHAQVAPEGSLVAGQSSLMHLDGWNYQDALVAGELGVHISWPRTYVVNTWWERRSAEEQRKANEENRQKLMKVFADAKAYYDAKQADRAIDLDQRWEAMLGLFDGSKKLYVHADDKRQLEQAIDTAQEYGFDLVLMGARDAWRIADELAELNVPVVFGSPYGLPGRDDEGYDQDFSSPARLAEAGVNFAISYPGYWDVRNLPFAAGNAVAFGLDQQQALAAITLKPAEILGVADKLGSLEVGKSASLSVSEGDLLDPIGQKLTHLYIDGRKVSLSSRHTELYEKYRQKPSE
ncbi:MULTISPECIES: amidohydrolase family protein [Idiomarina]|jgi:imidazolonepropionase-like amidohydrolase|uniref:Amidohydrolase family protein n=2 Tax=Idiomarina TaxID=135575 RepID=A0A8I1G903_9GAMM|nr:MULTISPECIES: amidohydrolase family protein [Idiomarina]KPD22955.1 amidohydrolase [Idiomarina abyssalis]MAO69288.1 amidohydrolase [Idiomarina sp.]MBF80638.1 amidohydrolase [Idiomarina sp.]MBJ7266482.1 amidohydrolase family protein [Idiomarina abyssalis]MBJ7274463.1 amidohydrolase family protein [Idiomarina abyssalis]|tara:strand:+ start:21143 stop:22444 length:1302 start_codon:yes stop_codon:yes gene_type:complete